MVVVGGTTTSNVANSYSPHGEGYKPSKRNNNNPSTLEYQAQYNSNQNNPLSLIGKGGGFFPNLRSKNVVGQNQAREANTLA